MSFDRAFYLDQTNVEQALSELQVIAQQLREFKTKYPHVHRQLCEVGLLFSDFNLADSETGIESAVGELEKLQALERGECRI